MSAATDLLAEYRERLPGAPPPLSFGIWIGGDLDGNPARGRDTIHGALDRARALALARYRREVRALAVALASSAVARRRLGRARGVDRPRRARAAGTTPQRSARGTSSSPTGASSRSCGGGSATTATAAPDELLADLARDPREPRGEPRRPRSPTAASRRSSAGSSCSASTSRSSTCACTRARCDPSRADAGGPRRRRRGAAPARAARARHA